MVMTPLLMIQSVVPLEVSMVSVEETPVATTSLEQLVLAKVFAVEVEPLTET
jgi:hypothetical protein